MFVLPMFMKEAWKVPEESKRTVFIRLGKHGSEPWGCLWKQIASCPFTACDPAGGSGVLHAHLIMFPGVFCGTELARTLKAESTACCSVGMLGASGTGCIVAL